MRLPIALSALVLLAGCASDPEPPAQTDERLNPARDFRPVSGEPSVDDIARFLAGRPVGRGAVLSEWQARSGDYHTHALNFDYEWRTFAAKRTARQARFNRDTLRPLLDSPSTIVYPFGGPDILYVSAMFPDASTYVLIGLESVGSVPDFSGGYPGGLLDGLSYVLDEPLRHGYFITEEMRKAPPAVPILLTSLGLAGARVDEVRAIDAGGYPGAEIRYRAPGGRSKKVVYVAGNLSNSGFGGSFRSWLGSYGGSTAYFKAASYLAHDNSFSGIRDWVLSNCRSVLQDDSGIPFRYYESSNWNATLLGTYERPIPIFSKWRQSDLAAAYSAIGGRGPEVPFGSGYHLKVRDANLQVYRRK